MPPAGNSFFNLGPAPAQPQQPQQAYPNVAKSPFMPVEQENEPMYAVDMMNPLNVPPPAPAAAQPLPPPIPSVPQNPVSSQAVDPAGIFDPMAHGRQYGAGPMPMGSSHPVPQAWHSRGPELIAPSPPSVDGQSAPNAMIRVQQTTRPTDMSRTVAPR